jgi:hypothetical protein
MKRNVPSFIHQNGWVNPDLAILALDRIDRVMALAPINLVFLPGFQKGRAQFQHGKR